jgi:hypothetical protein
MNGRRALDVIHFGKGLCLDVVFVVFIIAVATIIIAVVADITIFVLNCVIVFGSCCRHCCCLDWNTHHWYIFFIIYRHGDNITTRMI